MLTVSADLASQVSKPRAMDVWSLIGVSASIPGNCVSIIGSSQGKDYIISCVLLHDLVHGLLIGNSDNAPMRPIWMTIGGLSLGLNSSLNSMLHTVGFCPYLYTGLRNFGSLWMCIGG